MSNCLPRVRGWWVRGQRRGWVLQTWRALQTTDRRGAWSRLGGGSSQRTPPRETQQHRFGSDTPSMHPAVCFLSHILPLFPLGGCTDVFYIDVRHVCWPHPSSDGAQWSEGRRWAGAGTDWCGISKRLAADRAVQLMPSRTKTLYKPQNLHKVWMSFFFFFFFSVISPRVGGCLSPFVFLRSFCCIFMK